MMKPTQSQNQPTKTEHEQSFKCSILSIVKELYPNYIQVLHPLFVWQEPCKKNRFTSKTPPQIARCLPVLRLPAFRRCNASCLSSVTVLLEPLGAEDMAIEECPNWETLKTKAELHMLKFKGCLIYSHCWQKDIPVVIVIARFE